MASGMIALALATLLCCSAVLPAQTATTEPAAPKPAAAKPRPVLRTVAVLGYEVKWIDDPAERKELGEVLSTIVSDRLSAMDDLVIVERVEIEKLLAEQQLNLSGLVDERNRVKIGKLLGARFLLWGRGFKVGEQIYITTKAINVETGQFKGIIVQLPAGSGIAEVFTAVCDELVKKLPATLKALAPDEAPEISVIDALKLRFGDAKTSWLIAAHEEHRQVQPVVVVDPAVRNELEHLLSGAGQHVKSLNKGDARAVVDGEKTMRAFDPDVKCDYYLLAEGFSEFGRRLSGDLVVCTARVEVKVVDAKAGNVLAAGSIDRRATDLSEHLAGKQALRKAARHLFLDLSRKLFPEPAAKDNAGANP